MTVRKRHIEGFTLSELLLAVAIILILVLIAVPSVITAQNSVRMAELNDSARQIANVAQSQMSALKGAGTWYARIADDAGRVVFGKAKNLPADIDPTDVYYMTADEARDKGIVPALSIDEEVRSQDYVIEFDASTATVVSVFYSDRQRGFFDFSPSDTSAAQTYYEDGGSRTQAARLSAQPMIGYYEGPPEGATPEAALINPVIYVDGQSHLCIQNRNLDAHGRASRDDWFTTTAVTLTKTDGSAAFVISGLDETAQTFTVSLPDGSVQRTYSNVGDTQAITLTGRTESSTIDDVFAVDLYAIVRIVNADSGAGGLATAINAFSQGDDLRVDAEVGMSEPFVPAEATAFMKWPGRAALLAVYVTDPAPNADEAGKVPTGHIQGTYTKPSTTLLSSAGTPPVTGIRMQSDEKVFSVDTKRQLINENSESAHQAYAGGQVSLSEASGQQARVRVTVGSYRPSDSDDPHRYQINEIWINGARVGYLKQDAWVWEESSTASAFRGCLVGLPGGIVEAGTTSLTIDARTLASSDIPTNEDGGYDVYMRTAPRTDEVQTFFTDQASTIESTLSGSSGADSRRVGRTSRTIRASFENEFGASSTVSSWHMTEQAGDTPQTDTSAGPFPSRNDLRIYYASTPAVAWGDGIYGGQSPYTALPDAFLLLFKYLDGRTIQPTAFVRDARTGVQDNYSLVLRTNGDFEMPDDRDQLFFRIVEYCDGSGAPLAGYELQYVPYTVQGDVAYATVANGPMGTGGSSFAGWTYAGNPDVVVAAGSLIGTYDADLAFGYVQLNARYQSGDIVGFMYLEFDSAGNVSGHYGSRDGSAPGGSLPAGNEISSWGYYVVVPANVRAPWYQGGGDRTSKYNWYACSLARRSVFVDGILCDLYYAPTTWNVEDTYDVVPFKAGSSPVNAWNIDVDATPTYEYAYGFDLAAAVAAGGSARDVAASWGSESNPWNVRFSNQFPGCLDINNKQPHYLADSFVQTHDLVVGSSTVQWGNTAFSGRYDGDGYAVRDFALQPDARNGGIAGFFRTTDRATLRDIRLVDVRQVRSASEWSVTISGGSGARVGLLVGEARDTTVEGCSVAGMTSPTPGERFSLYLATQTYGENYIGALVGHASSSRGDMVIRDCRVENMSLVLINTLPAYSMEMSVGGLVGFSEETVIDERGLASGQPAVTSVHIELSAQSSTNASINMGGLLGRIDAGNHHPTPFVPKLSNAAITDVDLVSNIAGTTSAFYAGAIIGKTDHTIPAGELFPDMFADVRHNGAPLNDMIGNG